MSGSSQAGMQKPIHDANLVPKEKDYGLANQPNASSISLNMR